MAAFKRKKAQIEEVEPERMVTMCATCRTQLEEGLEHFNMDIPVVGSDRDDRRAPGRQGLQGLMPVARHPSMNPGPEVRPRAGEQTP